MTEQPGQRLPVAAHPAVQPRGRGEVVGGIVVEDLDVAGECGAQERALDEVVTEQRVLGEAAFENALEHVDLEDALSGERALTEDVLVGVGNRARVGVDARRPRVHRREPAAPRTFERHAHARLYEPVPRRDAGLASTPSRAVERVGDRRHELARTVARQDRVRVQRYDERTVAPELAHRPAWSRTTCPGARASRARARAARRACAPSPSTCPRSR